ncbi:hypothetical protein [Microbacterium sp.]|uniref:hypothetical protein n=1 Tax=Microbacterium sp. TaxID=51671 RepID=UPI003A95C1AA
MTQLRRLDAPRTDEQIDLSGLANLDEVSVEGAGLLSALRAPRLRRAFAEVDLLPQGFTFSSSVEEIEFSTNRVDARHLSGHSNLTRVACSDVKEVDFSGLDTAGTWNMLRLIRVGHLSGVGGLVASGPIERVDVEYVKQIESLEDLFALDIGYLYMEGCPQVDARVAHRYARKDRGLVPVRQRGGVRIVRDEERVELVFDRWAWLSVQLGGSVEDEPPVTSAELEDAFLAALRSELGTEFVSDRVQPDSEGDAVHLVFRQLADAKRAKKVLDGVFGDAATTLADARGAES